MKIGWKIRVLSAAPQSQTCQLEPFEVGTLHQGINAQLQQSYSFKASCLLNTDNKEKTPLLSLVLTFQSSVDAKQRGTSPRAWLPGAQTAQQCSRTCCHHSSPPQVPHSGPVAPLCASSAQKCLRRFLMFCDIEKKILSVLFPFPCAMQSLKDASSTSDSFALGQSSPVGPQVRCSACYALWSTMLPAQPAELSCPALAVHSPGAPAQQTALPQEAR